MQTQALQTLECMLVDMEGIANESWVKSAHSSVLAAQDIAYAMVNPDDVKFVPDTAWGLQQINEHLHSASALVCQAAGKAVPIATTLAALVDFATQYSERLRAAVCCQPLDLEALRQLTTVSGAKPYRDRPTPPIRREPVQAKAGQLTRTQLLAFVETMAGSLGTLNETLMMAQTAEADWQRERLLDAGQLMAQSLGAMADHMAGSDINGSIGRWMCGPSFDEMGRVGA